MQKKTVTIIGIGRVGLPLALFISNMGYKVFGIGRNQKKIDLLLKKEMPFIEEGKNLLRKHVNKNFFPTTSYESVKSSDILILTLGTPIDENMNPVLNQINDALDKIIPLLKKGQLIILRSTVSPQTTLYVKNKIELSTKYKLGRDIYLAYCPERIAEGHAISEIKTIPQIIGGVDNLSSAKAKAFFENLKIKCLITDSTSAELAKLFTNMYRYINFAISNEFMVIAENYDRNIHEIVNLVNTNYKRGGLAIPGLTGGPCLFKDGFFLINENPYIDLISASWKVNESIPLFLVKKLKVKISLKNKKILVLGLSFKPEVDDTRESLSFKIIKALEREHAKVVLHDPFIKKYPGRKIISSLDNIPKDIDAVIIATRHNFYYKNKKYIANRLQKKTYICDIWNLFELNKIIFKAKEVNNQNLIRK